MKALQALAALTSVALLTPSCAPKLPSAPAPDPRASLALDPPGEPAPPSARLRVSLAAPRDALRAHLVRGELSDAQRADVAAGSPSAPVAEREVGVTTVGAGTTWLFAPEAPLEAGLHTAVLEGSGEWLSFVVGPWDPWSLLRRAWPPVGGRSFAVLCGGETLPAFAARELELEGAGDRGLLSRGILEMDGVVAGDRCVRWRRAAEGAGEVGLLPPFVDLGVRRFYLDPSPLAGDQAGPQDAPIVCVEGELPLGAGCALVMDDRAVVRTPPARTFWVLRTATVELVTESQGEPLVLTPLPPSSQLDVVVGWARVGEPFTSKSVGLQTLAPVPHLVVNEVLANPVGPEPDSEWVELVNTGGVTIALEDWRLRDGGGEHALPGVDVKPGAYVLLVHLGVVPPQAPPGALIVYLEELGTNGLSNDGEPVMLIAPDGTVASLLPATPKPKEGKSVARIALAAPDANAASFSLATPTPGAPNAGFLE